MWRHVAQGGLVWRSVFSNDPMVQVYGTVVQCRTVWCSVQRDVMQLQCSVVLHAVVSYSGDYYWMLCLVV